VQVLYAGVLSESLSRAGHVDEEDANRFLLEGGQHDFAKARELLQILRNIRFPEAGSVSDMNSDLDGINKELWNKASTLVEQDYELIMGLGGRIVSELKMIGQEYVLSEAELENTPAVIKRFPPRL